ncbi:MAG TPA: DnaJ domain-containing protein [Candidatus Limnocylindrales bacterium]
MSQRDPHSILGVAADANQATIKAAWRRLARAHHPDLTAGDPAAAAVATRQMAEINAAYEELRRRYADRWSGRSSDGNGATRGSPFGERGSARSGGPPRPRPSRPVTGRVDTSDTFRPRNQTVGGAGPSVGRPHSTSPAPSRSWRLDREPPRASDPTGPLRRGRSNRFRPPVPPPLDAARGHAMDFGKFRGHTLGEIADFEPSYIDWIASTITRDPELVAAARVVREDMDERGVARGRRPFHAPASAPTAE